MDVRVQRSTQDADRSGASRVGDVAAGLFTGVRAGEGRLGSRLSALDSRGEGRDARRDGVRVDELRSRVDLQKIPGSLSHLDGPGRRSALPARLRVPKYIGKSLIGLSAAADALELCRAERTDAARGDGRRTETRKTLARVVGGWAGAGAGAAAGAAVGALLLPGVGPMVGALAFGVCGSLGGSALGDRLVRPGAAER